jgi:hypothetical protein
MKLKEEMVISKKKITKQETLSPVTDNIAFALNRID